MKKIICTVIFASAFIVASSQNRDGSSQKQMTVEEANRLNGVAEPTINGKPYSQYKAEQEALKQQKAAKEAALIAQTRKADNNDLVSLTLANAPKVAPNKPAEVQMEKTTVAELGKPDKPAVLTDAMMTPEQKTKLQPASSVVQNKQVMKDDAETASLPSLPSVSISADEAQAEKTAKQAEAKKQQEIKKILEQKPAIPETNKAKGEQNAGTAPVQNKTAEPADKLEKGQAKVISTPEKPKEN